VIDSVRAAEPVGPYPHARRVGSLLFLSGIGPRVRGQAAIPGVSDGTTGRDFEAQMRATLANVRAVLEDAGAGWEDIVDVTTFLTRMTEDFPTYNRLWAEAFPDPATRPTRMTVEVVGLPTPIDIELKVVAVVPDREGQRP
jgi:2-aminomuconate deaminase